MNSSRIQQDTIDAPIAPSSARSGVGAEARGTFAAPASPASTPIDAGAGTIAAPPSTFAGPPSPPIPPARRTIAEARIPIGAEAGTIADPPSPAIPPARGTIGPPIAAQATTLGRISQDVGFDIILTVTVSQNAQQAGTRSINPTDSRQFANHQAQQQGPAVRSAVRTEQAHRLHLPHRLDHPNPERANWEQVRDSMNLIFSEPTNEYIAQREDFHEMNRQRRRDNLPLLPDPVPLVPIPPHLQHLNTPPLTPDVLGATLQSVLFPSYPVFDNAVQLRRSQPAIILYRCRIYINCPYAQKELAKRRGAIWDSRVNQWVSLSKCISLSPSSNPATNKELPYIFTQSHRQQYVEAYTDLSPFAMWLAPGREVSRLLDQFRIPLLDTDGNVIRREDEHAYIATRLNDPEYLHAYKELEAAIFELRAQTPPAPLPINDDTTSPHAAPSAETQGLQSGSPESHTHDTPSPASSSNIRSEDEPQAPDQHHVCEACHESFPTQQQYDAHQRICPEQKMPAQPPRKKRKGT